MSVAIDHSAVRFGVVGALNTAAGLAVILGAKALLGAPDVAANAAGYGAGVLLSFGLNRRWTFRYAGRIGPALLRFLIVLAAAYLANLVTVLAALRAGLDSYLAQAAGVLPYAIVAYLGCQRIAFAGASQPETP